VNESRSFLLAAVTVLTLVAVACGSEPGDTDASAGSGTERDVAADSDPAPDDPGETTDPWLSVADTDLGPILVDADGFTLYALIGSNGDPGACTGACADIWPPAPFEDAGRIGPGVDPSQLGQTTRDDGTTQVVYGSEPLYRYRDDTGPGDVNGQGVNDVWFVIAPSGEVIGPGADAPASDAPPATDATDPFNY
jgi:predicted lipoprotein with Yx(FWY)xxD motif